MRVEKKILALSTLLLAAACGRNEVPPPDRMVDDLSWMDTVNFSLPAVASPAELGLVAEEPQVEEEAPVTRAAASTAPRRQAPRTTTARNTSSSGTYRAPAPAPAPQGRVVVERNTARDAAIGAGAGAAIGAVAAGRNNRVKGAIIGGAAGAVVGGVIGHTVDKKERVVYP
jgi:hypothetical protein